MKNTSLVLLLFVLVFACAVSGAAQKAKPRPNNNPATTTATPPPQPAPSPAASAAKTTPLPPSGVLQGKVLDLGWGDAVTLTDAQGKQYRVRMLGIDAPEKEQAFGPPARQKLSALVFGKAVTVKYTKVDRSGRPLGKVLLGAMDVNLEMLKAGLAWYYPNDTDLPASDRPLYINAELEARRGGRGLWQDETPIAPWEFRQARRQQQQQRATPNAEPGSEPAEVVVSDIAPAEKPAEPVAEKGGAPGTPGKEADAPTEQSDPGSTFPKPPKQSVTGDSSTRTYYKAGCPEVEKVAPQNRIPFHNVEEAEKAGFKRTPNCP